MERRKFPCESAIVSSSPFPAISRATSPRSSSESAAMKTLNSLIALLGAALATLSVPAAELAVTDPLTPEQSLAAFKVEPGLRVEIVAAEPLVVAPVAIAFDERGRLFVAEGRGYPHEAMPAVRRC